MLPAIVVGGWLGAGKTTLVNRVLRAAGGRRIAVLVNDFGDVGIDADLIVSRDGSVMNLAGGCVCCAVGSDLLEALVALPDREPPFDLVLLETSGVALPGSVARSARLAPGVAVDGTVVLVDAETVRARADDRHVGDTVRQQLAAADLLVLNKVDLVPHEAMPALRAWLRAAAPRAAVIEAVESAVPPEVVLGIGDAPLRAAASDDARATSALRDADAGRETEGRGAPLSATRRPLPAAAIFESTHFELEGRYDLAALATALADPTLGLVRAKGALRDAAGGRAVLQAVGTRVRTGPAPAGSAAADADAPARLVAIGLRGVLDGSAIAARIAAARRLH
ncbi:MAG: GTP-binding protein [Burkholderiales bacterium]|nr:GTP-binding protein [Burkholderiales bacterium]